MSAMDKARELLTELGLNELESRVYVFLLGNAPMTAYRIARSLGTPTANTYKAIDSLARRGAVLVEEGENRMCRAVPAAEFIAHVERTFAGLTKETAAALAELDQPSHDERVYKVESVALVMERCRQMLEERVERLAVIDAFPAALQAIRPSVERAVARGAEVLVQAYRPVEIARVEVAVPAQGAEAVEQWGTQQLNVVIDGREALIVLMDNELANVVQGVWTNSLYLACILEAGMMSEHTLHRLRAVPEGPHAAERMRALIDQHHFFLNTDIPGQKELLARFASRRRTDGAA